MRFVIIFVIVQAFFFSFAHAKLTRYEKSILDSSNLNLEVYETKNIVFTWPKGQRIPFDQSFKVQNLREFSQLIEKAYGLLKNWFRHDPNQFFQNRGNGDFNRLIFLVKPNNDGGWMADYHWWQKERPVIGLRDPNWDVIGTQGWFGWMMHELAHDFLHLNPVGQSHAYGEGHADFIRYSLLKKLKIYKEATSNRRSYIDNRYGWGYHGAAGAMIDLYELGGFANPQKYFDYLRYKSFATTIFPPVWNFQRESTGTVKDFGLLSSFVRNYFREDRDPYKKWLIEVHFRNSVLKELDGFDFLSFIQDLSGTVSHQHYAYFKWNRSRASNTLDEVRTFLATTNSSHQEILNFLDLVEKIDLTNDQQLAIQLMKKHSQSEEKLVQQRVEELAIELLSKQETDLLNYEYKALEHFIHGELVNLINNPNRVQMFLNNKFNQELIIRLWTHPLVEDLYSHQVGIWQLVVGHLNVAIRDGYFYAVAKRHAIRYKTRARRSALQLLNQLDL